MGSAQSANRNSLGPPLGAARYQRLPHSSPLHAQPLFQDQNLAIEGEKQEAAISRLKEKVEYLKKSVDGVIIGREADKRIYSAGFSNQGVVLKRLEEKNIQLEKETVELQTRVDEMSSTMVDMAAVVAELKLVPLQPKESNESAQVKITDLEMITLSREGLCVVLIFLIAVLVGLNL
ncbi:hypothetical protein VNO78_22442 [Psophocarpus tetragonolobus]|uniref:Uncharacterized protein n=1 Tax=Psophocarpus tetragonolobus TaxID=3891 RepID=A0AAN9S1M3_PSOTE